MKRRPLKTDPWMVKVNASRLIATATSVTIWLGPSHERGYVTASHGLLLNTCNSYYVWPRYFLRNITLEIQLLTLHIFSGLCDLVWFLRFLWFSPRAMASASFFPLFIVIIDYQIPGCRCWTFDRLYYVPSGACRKPNAENRVLNGG